MTETSLSIGMLVILFTVVFGLAAYFLIASFIAIKKNRKLIGTQEKQLLNSGKCIEEKKAKLSELSKKLRKAGRKLGRISQVKQLKSALKEEHKKAFELEMEVKRLKHNIKIKKDGQEVNKPKPDETGKIKQKYPSLPKNQLERIEIERSVARSLMKNNGGSFHISQVLRTIDQLYSKHIKPNDRITLFNEIKNWIDRDPLCKIVKTLDKVQYYTFI